MRTIPRAFARRVLDLMALFCVAALRVGLALLPFRWLMRLHRAAAGSVNAPGSPARGPKLPRGPWSEMDVRRSVHRASRLVPGARCLAQALAGQILLARLGQPSELKIGVAKDMQKGLKAHAWLESAGRIVLGEAEPGEYIPLEKAGDSHLGMQHFQTSEQKREA